MTGPATFRCDGCDGIASTADADCALPEGWRFVRPEGVPLLMCIHCAPPAGQAPTMTPDLCRRLAARGIRLNICMTLWGIGAPDRREERRPAAI